MALAVTTLVFDMQKAKGVKILYVMEMQLLGRDCDCTVCARRQGGALICARFIPSVPTYYKCK